MRVIPIKLQTATTKLIFEQRLFSLDLFDRVTRDPLERRVRLRDEGAHTSMNLGALADNLFPFCKDRLTQVSNRLNIFESFTWVADHEVQLNRMPAT